jgi:uncharacterized protein
MIEQLVQISELPVEGRELSFADQRIWADPIAEFHLPCRIGALFHSSFVIQPHQDGCMISGALRGSLMMPCARCAEEFELHVDVEFQEFESFPDVNVQEEEPGWIVRRDGLLCLDAAGFLWEQTQLGLPVKTLCSPQCRGVCAVCGANRNHFPCQCPNQLGDPRLSVLRTLNVS